MVFDTLLSVVKMPFFIVILLFCSYLIWSKFLNKNKLGIKNVNHLIDIFIIFLFLLASIGGFVILGLMFIGIINLNFDLPSIMKATPFLIGVFGVLLTISFIMGFRNKEGKLEDLEKSFKGTIKYFLIFALFLGSYYVFNLFTPLKVFVSDNLLVALFFSVVVLLFCWNIIVNTLFGEKLEKFLDKKSIPVLIGIFLLGILLSVLVTPLVNHQDIENQRIKIYDVDMGKLQKEYFISEANVSLVSSGWLSSIPSSIVLDYSRYGFIFNKSSIGNEFEIIAISNETGRSNVLDSYSDIESKNFDYSSLKGIKGLELKDGSVAIKFQRENFKENKIDYFILKGLIQTNISDESFGYSDNSRQSSVCVNQSCNFEIYINNSLDLPVDLADEVLVNLNNRGISQVENCKFNQVFVEYIFPGDIRRYNSADCSKTNDCSIDIRKDKGNLTYDTFQIHLSNNNEGVIYRSYTKIEEPMQVKLNFLMDC